MVLLFALLGAPLCRGSLNPYHGVAGVTIGLFHGAVGVYFFKQSTPKHLWVNIPFVVVHYCLRSRSYFYGALPAGVMGAAFAKIVSDDVDAS